MTINFDGNDIEFRKGMSAKDLINESENPDKKDIVAFKINGNLVDLSTELKDNDKISSVLLSSNDGLDILRHSTAHVLAYAVMKLFKEAKITIGPAVDNGFYYDIEHSFKDEDLKAIEKEMYSIVKQKLPFERQEVSIKDAKEIFAGNQYKIELIDDLVRNEKVQIVSVYKLGDFYDLCRGPHLPDTTFIKAYKLTKIAGAYWRADSKNAMLSRIYGLAFATKDDLKAYIRMLEEAEKRDHRKLGQKMDLFSLQPEGPGFPFWHAKGTVLVNELMTFMREELKNRDYNEIITPIILNKDLWVKSGHWDNFKQNMYFTKIDDTEYAVKPMNCPGGLLIYNSRLRSYKDLPLRNAEFGLVHRHELSGVLHGLFRVRSFTQDDAHSFCTEDQMQDEIIQMVDFVIDVYKQFGFSEYKIFVATKPQNYIGEDSVWEKATVALESALKKKELAYAIKAGEGAFYGPKIEFNIKDSIGRMWQCGTIQVDFSMPLRFEAKYDGKDGQKHTPVMIHRAVLGSLERFIGILIEHFEGKFPLWLSPEQIRIVPVAHSFDDYANEIASKLKSKFRVTADLSDDTLGKKIRNAETDRVNYVLVVGEKEQNAKTVNVRKRGVQEQKEFSLNEFIILITKEVAERSLTSHLH